MLRIAVICGGPSLERGISLNSARSVLDHLACEDVLVIPLYVDQDRQFYLLSPSQLYSNTPADFDFKLEKMAKKLNEKELKAFFETVDLAFPVIHGAFGENGELQALLEQWDVPYIASDSVSCRRMFHKYRAGQLLKEKGFPTLPSLLLSNDRMDNEERIKEFFARLHLRRAIIKPTSGGSSIGVYSVSSPQEAYEKGLLLFSKGMDSEALLEPFCQGIEFTVVVFENHSGEPVALIPTEIQTSYEGHQIFDYRKKYLPTAHTFYHTPPRFAETITQQIREQAQQLFKLFGMRDFVRMDGWVMSDNTIYITDLNPISGMEQNSFLFRQAAVVGLTHRETLQYILQRACKRYGIPHAIKQTIDHADKQKVYVLFGGGNAERQISLMSGANVWLKLMQSDHYHPEPYLLDPCHKVWNLSYSHVLNHTVEEVYDNCLTAECHEEKSSSLINHIQNRLGIKQPRGAPPTKMPLELFVNLAKEQKAFVFLALHGGIGENGTLQRVLEEKGVVYNGSDSFASALCMDKAATGEQILAGQDSDIIALPKKLFSPLMTKDFTAEDFQQAWRQICEELQANRLIIKPRQDGCSAGIVLLQSAQDLEMYCYFALSKSTVIPANTFRHQSVCVEMPSHTEGDFIFEPYIETDAISIVKNDLQHLRKEGWIELTVGVLEQEGVYHSLNPSITVAEGAVLSLEEKFQGGTGVNITPPPENIISARATCKIKHLIEKTAKLLAIKNYARIDIFFNCITEKMIVIEANTLPALTPSTVIYQQALAEEVPLPPRKFLETIIAYKYAEGVEERAIANPFCTMG